MPEYLSKSLGETAEIAEDFARRLKPARDGATIIGLYGELGSGKTTFMKYLAQALGVAETVQSPTFVIMRIFELEDKTSPPGPLSLARRGGERDDNLSGGEVIQRYFKHLIHIDAYRLESGEELSKLGWQEIIKDPKNLICLEWPDRVAEIMPAHTKIFFEHVNEKERRIKTE